MAETVTLDYEARYFRRRQVTTDQGRKVTIDASEARSYTDGETVIAADGSEVVIRAAPEPLAEIRGEWLARLSWHIGNRHTPCQIEKDRLLIQRDHVLEQMLGRLGAHVTHIEESFQPEGGAYGHGRTHAHAHAASAHDNPNAHIPDRHG